MKDKILIRDGSGVVYNKVAQPAVVFDSDSFVLLKIGEKEQMEEVFDLYRSVYQNAGRTKEADQLTLLILPLDQNLVDRVFQITGYLQKLINENKEEVCK